MSRSVRRPVAGMGEVSIAYLLVLFSLHRGTEELIRLLSVATPMSKLKVLYVTGVAAL